MAETFNISTLSWRPVLFLLAMVALPGVIAYLTLRAYGDVSAFKWALISTGCVAPLFLLVFLQMASVSSEVGEAGVSVGGGVYKVSVPLASIKISEIGLVERVNAPVPRWRSNGIGLPGLALGWFQGDKTKIFCVVSSKEKSVYIPTTLGYDILVSPDNPENFLASIHRLAAKDLVQ